MTTYVKKGPADKGQKRGTIAQTLQRLKLNAAGIIMAGSMLVSKRPQAPLAVVSEVIDQGDKEGSRASGESMVESLFAQNQSEQGTISINSSVESFDIRRTDASDTIEVRFQNGKTVTIETEPDSIQNSYIERIFGFRVPVDFETVVEYLRDVGVSKVTSCSCGGDDPKPKFRHKVRKNDMVAFERNDGSRLVVEFAPGAIKSITVDGS